MQQNVRVECPRCGRQLEKFNGHIGYCSQHKWVSPSGLGFDAEAAEQNRLDAEAVENKRLEAERIRQEEIARQQQEAHAQSVRKAILIIIALLVIAAGVTYFVIRPSVNYSNAAKKFEAGEYEAAREEYTKLGTYKDSAARVTLCDALIDLNEGRTEEAAAKLDLLTGDGQQELSSQLGAALLPVMANWQNKGLTPDLLLRLLQKTDVIDPKGTLDTAKLSFEGHAALLDGTQLSASAIDLTGDGTPELVTLNPDYSITAYNMAPDSNKLLAADETEQAKALMHFGNERAESDITGAAVCFSKANDLQSDDETFTALQDITLTILSEWKDRGIEAAEIPGLIQTADEKGIDLSGIDRGKTWQEAAIAAAGNTKQYTFTDWDGNAYEELLALYADGTLTLYGIKESSWQALSSLETQLSGGSFVIAEENTPLLLLTNGSKDELLTATGTNNTLSELFRESGLTRLEISSGPVTFSRELPGSIVRYEDYSYDAEGTVNRPVRVGIDWQQGDYPLPETAAAAVLRYFESRTYNIPEETALLIADSSEDPLYSPEALASLPAPSTVESLQAASFCTEEDREYFEVSYSSGTQSVRTWVIAENLKAWKTAGASDTYGHGLSTQDIDFTLPLLSLNAKTDGSLSTRGSRATYRVLLPQAGRLGLTWQSGTKSGGSVSHNVNMVRGALSGESVFSYSLQPSTSLQQTNDMFVSAGVYYVTVEARTADAAPYSIMLTFKSDSNVELESNDTYQTATALSLNNAWSGNLSSAADVDWFSFTLDEPAQVNLSLETSGSGRGSSTSHTLSLYSGNGGSVLTSIAVPGNAKLTESGTLYLSEGTYLVQITKGSSTLTDEYVLTVSTAEAAGNSEFEPNDSYETANLIPLNEEIQAAVSREGDIDCYRFTLDADAVIQPRFSFKPSDSASKTYVLTIADRNGQELQKTNVGGKESAKVFVPLALPAGTYYVKVDNPRFIRQEYTLMMVSMPVEKAEQEINDSLGLANTLEIDSPVTGVLASETDNDYYKLSFADTTAVTLKFSFAPTTVTSTAFVLTIEQNGKTQLTANIKGDSGIMEQQLQFSAGEYYIRIKPSAWIGSVYTIEMK